MGKQATGREREKPRPATAACNVVSRSCSSQHSLDSSRVQIINQLLGTAVIAFSRVRRTLHRFLELTFAVSHAFRLGTHDFFFTSASFFARLPPSPIAVAHSSRPPFFDLSLSLSLASVFLNVPSSCHPSKRSTPTRARKRKGPLSSCIRRLPIVSTASF